MRQQHRQLRLPSKPGLSGQTIKSINSCQAQGDLEITKSSLVEIIKDFKAAIIIIRLHEIKKNKFEMREKIGILSTEVETVKEKGE